MKRNTTKRMGKKLAALGLALTLGLSLGSAALAEAEAGDAAPSATTQPAAAALTDEEKTAARAAARTAYDAAVDAALVDIVAAGGLTQEAVDSYHALRDAERLIEKIDTSAWTAEQRAAYEKAFTKGSVDEDTLTDLVNQGLLTEADAAALRLAYGEHVTISDLMAQADTTKADPALVTAITDARTAYGQALQDAGLFGGGQGKNGAMEGRDKDGMPEGSEGRGNGGVKGRRGDSDSVEGSDSGEPAEDSAKKS